MAATQVPVEQVAVTREPVELGGAPVVPRATETVVAPAMVTEAAMEERAGERTDLDFGATSLSAAIVRPSPFLTLVVPHIKLSKVRRERDLRSQADRQVSTSLPRLRQQNRFDDACGLTAREIQRHLLEINGVEASADLVLGC